MIAKVEPLTPARALRGPFDYVLAGALEGVGVGSMLVVPFGRRRLLGVVVDLAEESELPPERLAQPLAALEADVPERLVRLGLWVAREYVSTPARGLALVLPPGTGTGSARPLLPRRSLRAALTDDGRRALRSGDRLGSRQQAVLHALEGGGAAAVATVARRAGADHSTLRSLERRGLVALENAAEPPRRPRVDRVGARAGALELTAGQEAVLGTIRARLGAPGRPLLLHGVTGSGKTEVYLRAVAAVLERGGSAIVLVPEIALTPQTAGRFVERFGDSVAVMHSRLTPRERYDEWWRMRRGEARVCVGPRSAVFAPLPDLGLIVIDEEHDGSYKQEGDPRYDARVVAERRAALEGALLLAGSATPRPESLVAWERLELPARVDGRRLPPVELVAMAGSSGPLHERTRQELDGVRRRGEKAIVLLNRRGWSNFISCRLCGRVWECPNCDVTLVYHQAAAEIACHHCGHRERAPSLCPECDSVSVARHGAGTEQLERELEALVAPLPVFRLDSDVAAAAGIATVLRRFDAAARGRAGGHADGGQGPRLPRRDAGRGARRRRHAALPRLPCRGAHLRAGGPARRPQRPRRARRARDRPGARAGRARPAPRRRARLERLPGRRAAAPRGVRLPALRAPDPRGLLVHRARARGGRRAGRARADRKPPACPRSAPRRCFAARAATAPSWSCAPASASRRSPRSGTRWSRWRSSARTGRWPSRWTSIRNS